MINRMRSFYNYSTKETSWLQNLALTLFLSALIILSHGIHLTADTPGWFAKNDTGMRVDEGYKTLAARNLALFGRTQWSEQDDYPGWFRHSPLTQSVQYIAYKLFEPSLAVARAAALIYYLALVILVLSVSIGVLSIGQVAVIVIILATEPMLFYFSRLALFEVCIAALLTVAIISIRHYGFRGLLWAGLFAAAGSFLVKKSVLLYLFPSIATIFVAGIYRKPSRRMIWFSLAAAALMAALLYFSRHTWLWRVDIIPNRQWAKRLATSPIAVWSPWLAAAAWLCAADFIRQAGPKLFGDYYFLSIAATVVGGPILLSFFEYTPVRYFVALVPANILMIAYWMEKSPYRYPDQGQKGIFNLLSFMVLSFALLTLMRGGARLVIPLLPFAPDAYLGLSHDTARLIIVGFAVVFVFAYFYLQRTNPAFGRLFFLSCISLMLGFSIVTGVWHVAKFWGQPSYASHEVRRNLQSIVEPEKAVIGDWAPFFALGTGIPAIYSTTGKNTGGRVLDLQPNYYLYSGTKGDDDVLRSYREIPGMSLEDAAVIGRYNEKTIYLYRIEYPD